MKKKSTSQNAFFNLRVLVGLTIVFVGVVLALQGLGVFSATAANLLGTLQKHQIITRSTDPLVPVGFAQALHDVAHELLVLLRRVA